MIQFLSEKTARYLAEGDETADIEVLAYGYYMFYQQWLTVAAILLISLPFGIFPLVLASLVTSMVLRGCVGGTHARHPVTCKITTFLLAFLPALFAGIPDAGFVLAFIVVSFLLSGVLVLKYAPGETDVRKFHPNIRKRLKVKALVWVCGFSLVAGFLYGSYTAIAFVVSVSLFLTCCFAHPLAYRLFGFDPVTKEPFRPR